MQKKLYRSKDNRIIAGVCGGLSEYTGIDTALVRVFAVALLLVQGIGGILYIIACIVIPEEDSNNKKEEKMKKENNDNNHQNTDNYQSNKNPQLIVGTILIIIGALFLVNNLVPWLSIWKLWPTILVVVGIMMLVKSK